MAIGKQECKIAQNTDLAAAVRIGLDEAYIALEESFYDLTDGQAVAFPITGRNNIAWIVMHCLQNLDHYANTAPTNDQKWPLRALKHEERYDLWEAPDDQRPKPGDTFLTVREMLEKLNTVREKSLQVFAERDDANVSRNLSGEGKGNIADCYMRTIYHTMSHVRQIWALRGMMGSVDTNGAWPRQHWA